ncbi:MAG: hypothetical protein AAGJ53_00835, partial [Pseudomonadota bacterium]
MNLTRFVSKPFTPDAKLDTARLTADVRTAVRFLDNIIDVSNYPLAAQREEAFAKRRLGLGITGLANALAMCGARYGSRQAVTLTDGWLRSLKVAAYDASAELAEARGAFPLCDREALLASPNLRDLPETTRSAIARHGLRNGCLTTIAPTGTISLLAGNVSSGIEPTFARTLRRRMLTPDGSAREVVVADYAAELYRAKTGDEIGGDLLPDISELTPEDHIRMQTVAQRHIDSAISKTINCPADLSFDAFRSLYLDAYDAGLKGCTTYRPSPRRGSVLEAASTDGEESARAPDTTEDAGPMAAEATPASENIVYLTKPAERPEQLQGTTYRRNLGPGAAALIVTINDEVRNGRPQPAEILLQATNGEQQVWLSGLAMMASALIARDGNLSGVVDVLRRPPRNLASSAADRQAQSGQAGDGDVLAALAEILAAHEVTYRQSCSRHGERSAPAKHSNAAPSDTTCPSCGADARMSFEGCWVCRQCGVAACG